MNVIDEIRHLIVISVHADSHCSDDIASFFWMSNDTVDEMRNSLYFLKQVLFAVLGILLFCFCRVL